MKSIHNKVNRDEIVDRIRSLNAGSRADWGRMTVYQMLKHCTLCEEMYHGKKKYNRVLLGRIIGKMVLKRLLDESRPFQRNAPTNPGVIVKETQGDIEAQKAGWSALIQEYAGYPHQEYMHWFFGKMSREQIGQFVYKHADHHLRQFKV